MFDNYKTAVIQMSSSLFDTWSNKAKAVDMVGEAISNGAKLICLPEGFLTGYDADRMNEIVRFAEPIDGSTMDTMKSLAKQHGVHILVPLFTKTADGVRNSAFLIDSEGEVISSYSKAHLIGGEKNALIPGNLLPVWETDLGKIGILICYDICFPETVRELALKGAELILVPSAWRAGSYFKRWWDLDLSARALDDLLYIAAPNLVGNRGETHFLGRSKIVGPTGEVLAACGEGEEGIAYSRIDRSRLVKERRENTVLEDRRFEIYHLRP